MIRVMLLVLSGLLFSMLLICTASAVQFNVKERLLDRELISKDIDWTVIDVSQYQPWELGIRTAYFSMQTSLYSTCEDDNVLFQIRPYGDDINMREQKVVSSDSRSSQGDDHVQYVQMPINSSNKLEYRVTGLTCSEADVELWAHEAKDYHISNIATCTEGSSIREIHEDGTVECETDDSGDVLWTQDGSDIYYNNGVVGIGNAVLYANRQLSVKSPSGGTAIWAEGDSVGIHAYATISGGYGVSGHSEDGIGVIGSGDFGVYGSSDNGTGIYGNSSTGIAGYFSTLTGYGLIVANGNVGIGTIDPESILNVQGGSIQVGTNTDLHTTLGGNDLQFNRDGRSYISQMGAGSLVFTTNGGSGNPRMIINSTGNVGVGTTNPVGKLHVEAGEGEGLRVTSSNGNSHFPYSDGWSYIAGKGIIFRTNGNNERMRLTSDGLFLFGTSGRIAHPSYAVQVNSSVYVSGRVDASNISDLTPYPKNLETAYAAVISMDRLPLGEYDENDKENQLDHSKLHEFVKADDGKHRNLSATVSAQNEVIKDLLRRIQDLEAKVHELGD